MPHTYIRLSLTTKKAMGIVQKEIENILPFLERHYGRLVVSVSPKKRSVITILDHSHVKSVWLSAYM